MYNVCLIRKVNCGWSISVAVRLSFIAKFNPMTYSKAAFLFLLAILLSACGSSNLTRYTDNLDDSLGYDERQLKKVQFYTSRDIVLRNAANDSRTILEDGTIVLDRDTEVQEVLIAEGTPGTVVDVLPKDRLAVSFSANPRDFLVFGPSKREAGAYVLLAKDWNNGVGKVAYGGKVYNVNRSSGRAALLVDLRSTSKVVRRTSSEKGRKVN